MAIPLTTGSAPAPAALIDGDRMLIVELRERDPELVPWCARRRTPRSSEVWLRLGEAGRASGPSTAALPAATASLFTGDLRAARCVARHAGSMLSGGPPPSCSTSLPFPMAPEASDVASRRLPRQPPRSRSATYARVKPEQRSKSDADRGARAAFASALKESGLELFLAEISRHPLQSARESVDPHGLPWPARRAPQ